MPISSRIRFLDVGFDRVTLDDAAGLLSGRKPQDAFAFVVTPNVDHVVRLHEPGAAATALTDAYERAWLCVCDSRILQRLARMCGIDIPVVPGSDLTARLLDKVASPGDVMAVVGGSERLLRALSERYPDVHFRQHSPPMGLATNSAAIAECAAFVKQSGARFAFLAVGSPQQEMIASAIASDPDARGTALCIGASLDFLSGDQKRAPAWMQRGGLEWLHRLVTEPRRMWRRYLVDDPKIFLITRRWHAARERQGAQR